MIEPDGFELLYEEGPFLVVNKPGGILTQAPPGIESLEVRIKQYLKARDNKPGKVYLGVPHRLDRPVSGAMLFAKHVRAARRLSEQFEGRIIEKTYWAVVEGIVEDNEGTWHDVIRKVPNEPRAEIVDDKSADSRAAILHYRVIERLANASWLEMRLETGRYHQIRVQAASRGFPVLGDQQYGSTQEFGPPSEDPRRRWIALHARRLNFRHPMTRARTVVDAPWPSAWQHLNLSKLADPDCMG